MTISDLCGHDADDVDQEQEVDLRARQGQESVRVQTAAAVSRISKPPDNGGLDNSAPKKYFVLKKFHFLKLKGTFEIRKQQAVKF